MIDTIRTWLLAVITMSMAVSLAELLAPAGTLRRALSATGGLLLLLTILQPVVHMELPTLHLEDCQTAIEQRTQELQEEQTAALSAGIAERTAAYITDKAQQLGIVCTVQVGVESDDSGVLRPVSAVLDCSYQAELSRYMADTLGISEERQSWYETEESG